MKFGNLAQAHPAVTITKNRLAMFERITSEMRPYGVLSLASGGRQTR